jgi:hypothetical protein
VDDCDFGCTSDSGRFGSAVACAGSAGGKTRRADTEPGAAFIVESPGVTGGALNEVIVRAVVIFKGLESRTFAEELDTHAEVDGKGDQNIAPDGSIVRGHANGAVRVIDPAPELEVSVWLQDGMGEKTYGSIAIDFAFARVLDQETYQCWYEGYAIANGDIILPHLL